MSVANILLGLLFILTAAIPVVLLKPAWGNRDALPIAEWLHRAATILAGILLLILTYYFIVHAYQFVYVYENSSNDLPLLYRISAVWAGKEGSFLLWLFFLYCCGTIAGLRGDDDMRRLVLPAVAFIEVFIVAILLKESPFAYIWDKFPGEIQPGQVPTDGAGLNTLLIDPWMIVHPPVLFLGYASATIPFAYAAAALVRREFRSWAVSAYPWVVFSMASLGLGIFLGGYWAYAVLGWGGYWGWDPVENSSLIPWLVSIALMHALLLQKKAGMLHRTSLALALSYLVLVIYSAFLTRSGVLSNFSVHSFGESRITWYLLVFLLTVLTGSVFLFFSRMKQIPHYGAGERGLDWRSMIIAGVIGLVLMAAFILGGTSMPIVSGLIGKPTAVTTKYYVIIAVIIGVPSIIIMIAAMTFMVPRQTLKKLLPVALVVGGLGTVAMNLGHSSDPAPWIFMGLAIAGLILIMRDLWAMKTAAVLPGRVTHLGICFMVLGIMTSTYHSPVFHGTLEKEKEATVGPVTLSFKGLTGTSRGALEFDLVDGAARKRIAMAYFIEPKMNSLYREPRILTGIMGDTYIAPEEYRNGLDSISIVMLKKGEEKKLGDITVRFEQFATQHMTSGTPTILAELTIQGQRLKPGLTFADGHRHAIPAIIPGTDRAVSLMQINADDHSVLLRISPGKNVMTPPDTVAITVSYKRLIILVWAGTIMVTVGTYLAMRSRWNGKRA